MYLSNGFMVTLWISFFCIVGSLCLFANQSYLMATPEEANQTRQQIESERQVITAEAIFVNNLFYTISLIIPLIGIVPFAIVWRNTGVIIGFLAKAYGINPIDYVLSTTVLAFPEMLAYTVLLAENIYLSFLVVVSRSGAKERLVTNSWKSLIIYLVLLIVGAITEALMLR